MPIQQTINSLISAGTQAVATSKAIGELKKQTEISTENLEQSKDVGKLQKRLEFANTQAELFKIADEYRKALMMQQTGQFDKMAEEEARGLLGLKPGFPQHGKHLAKEKTLNMFEKAKRSATNRLTAELYAKRMQRKELAARTRQLLEDLREERMKNNG